MEEIELSLGGNLVLASARRSLIWPEEKTVFVADVHFGKDDSLRAAGWGVPSGATSTNLELLSMLVRSQQAGRLVILGDAFHSHHAEIHAIQSWRAGLGGVEVLMVIGNHDRKALHLAEECGFDAAEEGRMLGPWVLRHHPGEDARGYVLCGHLHPAASLRGPGRQMLRLPCFVAGPRRCILPAFGTLTGGAAIRPHTDEVILVPAGTEIIRFP